MALIIFLIFIFVWYFPVWRRQGQADRLPRRTIPKAIVCGAIPAFVIIIVLQVLFGFVRRALPVSERVSQALEAYIGAALVEECVKFFTAYLIIRRIEPKRKVDYVLIFGAVGMGYELTESIIQLDSVLTGIMRGVFSLHIIWQFWMGMFFWEYRQAKQRGDRRGKCVNFILAFAVPILLHGTNDFLAFVNSDLLTKNTDAILNADIGNLSPEAEMVGEWFFALLVFVIIQTIFQFVTFGMALKTAKQSRQADEEARAEAEAEIQAAAEE